MKLILASEFPQSFLTIQSILGDDLAGEKGIFVPTAAYGEGWEPDINACMEPLQSLGLKMKSFDLRDKTEFDADEVLSDAAVIYVGGGNTFFLLEHMHKCNFEKILRSRLAQGLVYVGSSAGSVVCSPDIAYIEVMDDRGKASLTNTRGLSLINVLFVPHLDHGEQGESAQRLVDTYQGETTLIALYDSQVLYVQNKILQVL